MHGCSPKAAWTPALRRVEGVDGHDIDCRIDGFGAVQLKSSVVKKG